MKRSWSLISAAVLLASPAWAQDSDVDAIRKLLTSYAEMAQAKNLSGMEALFAQDRWVHIIEGAGVNHGWADYRDRHLGPELEEAANFRMRYFAIEPQVRGDLAWAAFRHEVSAELRGNKIDNEGRGTAVLERRDGRWLMVHLHTSGRRKPAAGGI